MQQDSMLEIQMFLWWSFQMQNSWLEQYFQTFWQCLSLRDKFPLLILVALLLQWQGEGAPCCSSRSAVNTAALPHVRRQPLSPRVPSCVLRVCSVHVSACSAAALSPLSCVFTQVNVSLSGWGRGGRKLCAKYETFFKREKKKNLLRNWNDRQSNQNDALPLQVFCAFCDYLQLFNVCVFASDSSNISCSFEKRLRWYFSQTAPLHPAVGTMLTSAPSQTLACMHACVHVCIGTVALLLEGGRGVKERLGKGL